MPVGGERANRVLNDGRAVLARFGYRSPESVPEAAGVDWPALWDQLRGDFATHRRPHVPALAELDGMAAKAAQDYMRCALDAARKLDRCEVLHARLLGDGIASDRVEAYAVVRDAYEDAVEAFGAAGARLGRLLADR